MNLNGKIFALCILVFCFCGVLFGVLERRMSARQQEWGTIQKAEGAAIAAANFAKSDMKFAAQKNLEQAIKRAELSSLTVVRESVKSVMAKSRNPLTEICDGIVDTSYYVTDGDFYIVARCQARIVESENITVVGLALWGLGGILFGAITAIIVSFTISRRISELRCELESGVKKNSRASARISELDDLAYTANLMRQVDALRAKNACAMLDGIYSDVNLEKSVSAEIASEKYFEIGDYKISIGFAHEKSDGSFCAKFSENGFLFGRIADGTSAVQKVALAELACNISLNSLKIKNAWEAFLCASKYFNFTHWSIIEVCQGHLMRVGLDVGDWSEEKIEANVSLLGTLPSEKTMRLYAHLDLGAESNRLDNIIKLTSENECGMLVLIEKK